MRLNTLFAMGLVISLAGCATPQTPEQRAAEHQRRAEERQRHAIEHAANQQRAQIEREANNVRHAAEARRDAEEDLRRKFLRFSTGDLKLMNARYRELQNASGRDLNVKVNSLRIANTDAKNVEKVLEIERELLRRWQAGDAEAYLPDFGVIAPAQK